jgi:hypothetical protein
MDNMLNNDWCVMILCEDYFEVVALAQEHLTNNSIILGLQNEGKQKTRMISGVHVLQILYDATRNKCRDTNMVFW